jgi:UDP-glucose 4-epimerase
VTVFGDGAQTRDYIYVDDVVDALVTASGSDRAGAYNVGTGRETSVLDLVAALSSIFDFDRGPEFAPERPGEILRCAISPERTAGELGWRAGMAIDDGLATTADWVRERPQPGAGE